MQEYINSLISNLKDKNIQKILVNLSKYVDENVEQYQEDFISDTVVYPQTQVIYTQLVKRGEIELISDSFVPIVDIIHNDNWVENFKILYINDADFDTTGSFIYAQVYYTGDLKRIIDEKDNLFSGSLRATSGKTVEFKYRLLPNEQFHQKEEMLYRAMMENKVQYTTPFSPYARRLFDVVVTDILCRKDKIEEFEKCEVILPDIQQGKYDSALYPVWNIKFITVPFQGTTKLQKDKSLREYSHPYKANKLYYNEEVEFVDIKVINNKKRITTSDRVLISEWIEIEFLSPLKNEINKTMVQNNTNSSILNTLSSFRPRTKTEVLNLLKSLDLGSNIEIEKIRFVDDIDENLLDNSHIIYNGFIKDEFIPFRQRYQKCVDIQISITPHIDIEEDIKYYIKSILHFYYPEIIWRIG